MSNIVNLSNATGKATFKSPKQCLEECLNEFIGKAGAFKNGKKLLVLCVDDTVDEQYHISWSQAGFKMSELLSACDIAKQHFKREMNLTVFPEDL